MPRLVHRAVLLQAAIAALLVGCVTPAPDRAAIPPAMGGARAGDGRAEAGPYSLERLPVLSFVILSVNDHYFDPSRIDPRRMVVAALDAVAGVVPELVVEGDATADRLVLAMGSARHVLEIAGIDTIWKVAPALREAMRFLAPHLAGNEDPIRIEYAAGNGMLSTLDPDTTLLEPKVFREMRLQTSGRFGALGAVIQVRDGSLAVVKVLANAPAARAGIRPGDVIAEIDGRSTVNVDLQQARDWLLGEPGSRVTISLVRPGETARSLALTREVVQVETIPVSKLVGDRVAHVRLAHFSSRASQGVSDAVARLRREAGGELRGLVLDLRENGGGLLEQAAHVADLFLSSGTIFTTTGEGRRQRIHEVKEARADPTAYADLPVVVLVDGRSAGSSEIVAGALEDGGRAVIVGRDTFGLGLVHVLHMFNSPGDPGAEMALKIAIAQYLRPSGLPFADAKISPDVLVVPACVPSEKGASVPPAGSGERAGRAAPALGSPLELRYLADEDERERAARRAGGERRCDDSDEGPAEPAEDPALRFATEVLARGPTTDRRGLLEAARALVDETAAEEDARLGAKLAAAGVEWGRATSTRAGTPRATVTVSPPPGSKVMAGETVSLTVTVANDGDSAFSRLRGSTHGEGDSPFGGLDLFFGAVGPGERRSWTVAVPVPSGAAGRRRHVTVRFEDEDGRAPPELRTWLEVVERPRPRFALAARADDGNDGLLERGESVRLRVEVRNGGEGRSGERTQVLVKNMGGEEAFITKGRHVVGAMAPGETRFAELELRTLHRAAAERLQLRVSVVDPDSGEHLSAPVAVAFHDGTLARLSAGGAVRVIAAEALVRAGASAAALPLAAASQSAVLPVRARFGEFYEVAWGKARTGFVAESEVRPQPSGTLRGPVAEIWHREQPRIAVGPDAPTGAVVLREPRWRLEVDVSLPPSRAGAPRLRDVRVLANGRKVAYAAGEEDGLERIAFSAEVPLSPGDNAITVVAREADGVETFRTVHVFRTDDEG